VGRKQDIKDESRKKRDKEREGRNEDLGEKTQGKIFVSVIEISRQRGYGRPRRERENKRGYRRGVSVRI